jgi:hypothetical protein
VSQLEFIKIVLLTLLCIAILINVGLSWYRISKIRFIGNIVIFILGLSIINKPLISYIGGVALMLMVALMIRSSEIWMKMVARWKASPNKIDRVGYERIEGTITHFSTKSERAYDQNFTLVSLEFEFEYEGKTYRSSHIDLGHQNSLIKPARFQAKDATRLFSGFEVGQKIFVRIYLGTPKFAHVLENAIFKPQESSETLVHSVETA